MYLCKRVWFYKTLMLPTSHCIDLSVDVSILTGQTTF